ncbi:MAG TPA: tyrosine-type recombinase/integrase [Pirellulales bacterium]|nr:tyrosine-type recombinase/integrase [Pirellulales bacterium]
MASISSDQNGNRTVQFIGRDRKRKSIRLGHVSLNAARTFKTRVEALNAAKLLGHGIDNATAEWVAERDDVMLDKLADVGLIERRGSGLLGQFVESYVDGRTDVKPATKEIWEQGRKGLIGYFGEDKPIREITPGDADAYKLHLLDKKLAPMTVRKRLQFAKMITRAAIRNRLIGFDPFVEVNIKPAMPDRARFITPDETAAVLKACRDRNWRSIVALARWGGLRCPSEVLSLRWTDVDWEENKVLVTSPKTEHHPGKASRTIPLFPELRAELREAFEVAPDGAVYVVAERFRLASNGPKGWRNCNLRTTFEKIVKRAGLEPWPRLFHNLRASRQTELAERFPSHVVCAWLGNSEDIARQHYYQVTDQHFKSAAGALHNPVQQPSETGENGAQRSEESQSVDSQNVL